MSTDNESKIIGYFAYSKKTGIICDRHRACIIIGSEENMQIYLDYVNTIEREPLKTIVKKTKFIEIAQGMAAGGAYSFDEKAYNRFYPIANCYGKNYKEYDFSKKFKTGFHFLTIIPKNRK
jgi:hypothetical protein